MAALHPKRQPKLPKQCAPASPAPWATASRLAKRQRRGLEKKRPDTEPAMFRSSAELRALHRAERRVQKAGLGRIIASRVLTEQNARAHKITVLIGAPRRVEADHWLCPFFIEGIVESGIQYTYGVDALQALVSALGGVRVGLEQTG